MLANVLCDLWSYPSESFIIMWHNIGVTLTLYVMFLAGARLSSVTSNDIVTVASFPEPLRFATIFPIFTLSGGPISWQMHPKSLLLGKLHFIHLVTLKWRCKSVCMYSQLRLPWGTEYLWHTDACSV